MKTKQANDSQWLFKRSKTSLCVLSALGMLATATTAYAQQQEPEETEETEVIEVTGLRSSIISAKETKFASDKIMDGISADDIGALPDRSVTETLQRIAGVSIDRYMSQGDPEHFSVEGNGVIVRGMSEVRSELNGRSTFSANSGRALSFGDVPPELLSAVNVYKSPSADQIEGGLGGTVDLETRLPFQNPDQQAAFTLTANYGDLIEEVKPAFSALYSNTWDTDAGKVGFLVDVASSKLSTRNDSMYVRPFFTRTDINGHEGETVYVPRGADWRSMHFERERTGAYAALQWAPTDNQELTFTYFLSDYDMQWDEDAIFVENDALAIQTDNATFGADGVLQTGRLYQDGNISMGSDVRVSVQNAKTEDFSLRYRWFNDDMAISTSIQRVESTSEGLDSTVATQVLVPYIDVDFTGSLPTIDSDEAYLSEPSNYVWNFAMDNQYDREASMTAVDVDVSYYIDNDVFHTVRFGGRYSDSKADNADTGYNWSPLAVSWLQWALVEGSPIHPDAADLNLNTFDNFFGGKVPSPANVFAPNVSFALDYPNSYTDLQDRFQIAPDTYQEWAIWSQRDLNDEQWQNNQSEKTYAVYAMVDFEYTDGKFPVTGNVGARYVRTENTAHGHLQYPNVTFFGGGAYETLDAENSYTNFLPSLNLKVEFSDELLLRFAASKAMARPDFSRMGANITLSAGVKDGVTGDTDTLTPDDYNLTLDSDSNPYLDPQESVQFDLSLEWYFDDASSIYGALFTKDIDGYIVDDFSNVEYGGYEYYASWPVSEGEAKISGFEFSVNHFFTELPEPFDGLGVSANYTYIDSDSTDSEWTDTDGAVSVGAPVLGLSKDAFNLVGIYEKGPFSIRLAYNWRSKYLTSIGANGFNGSNAGINWSLPLYNAPAGYLDGSFTYKINDNFDVSLEANNLANTVTKNTIEQGAAGNHYGAYHVNDVRYALSLRGHF